MRRLLLIVLLVLLASSAVAAKDWRGILPMHSTREDVIAMLGQPAKQPDRQGYMSYSLDEGDVSIVYADEDFLKRNNCPAVAAGTVLMIYVAPREELVLSSLNLDEKKFRKFDPSKGQGFGSVGFIDDKEGVLIRASEGKVQEMIYFASATDRERCQGYLENPETLVEVIGCPVKFDQYGALSFSDEKARLDNFAIQLTNSEKMLGYIVVYAGRKATVAEGQIRGNRARDYLINVRKIDPERVKAIDAGHKEDAQVDLWIWPADSEPPPSEPTVDKSEVEIIYAKKKRTPGKRH